jgi:hypothetical protein
VEKFNSLLNKIYGNSQNLMYFYVGLSAIALIFIILIIATIIKGHIDNKKAMKLANQTTAQDAVSNTNNIENASNVPLTETNIKTDTISEIKEETVNLSPEVSEVSNESNAPKEISDDLKVDNNLVISDTNNSPELNQEEPEEIEKKYKMSFGNVDMSNVYLEKDNKTSSFDFPESSTLDNNDGGKSISELLEEDKPLLEPADISPIEVNSSYDNYTIEMPKVKPIDLDDYLSHRESESVKEENVESPQNVIMGNDEIKSRLAKLKEQNRSSESGQSSIMQNNPGETPKSNPELEDLMKAVGLEDTMVIPKLKDEESILGR